MLADDSGGRGKDSGGHERSSEVCRSIGECTGSQGLHGCRQPDAAVSPRSLERDLSFEDMSQLEENAPWVCQVLGKKARNVARRIQLEDMNKSEEERRIQMHFWLQTGDIWKFHTGILPWDCEDSPIAVSLMTQLPEETYLDEVDSGLSRGCRKRLRKELSKLVVSELYSQPRVAVKAVQEGLQAGTSFDLLTALRVVKDAGRNCSRRTRIC